MEMKNYKVVFDIKGLDSKYEKVKDLDKYMENELIRVHNLFADKTNGGVTDKLNEEFNSLYPGYFEDNDDKLYEDLIEYNQDMDESYLIEYNQFMDEGYQKMVLDEFNKNHVSQILNFKSESGSLVGYLRDDENVTIRFWLVEVD